MLTAHGHSHPGTVRKINEDCWLSDPEIGLFIVADGMGGHNAGEVASQMAVEAIRGFLVRSREGDDFTWPYGIDPQLSYDANRLMTSLKLANRRVFKVGESRDEYTGMGTTVVAGLVEGNRLIFSGVGDSRIYSHMNGALSQITEDDSWVATVLGRERGFDRASLSEHPMRHVLTNVIGAREQTEMEVSEREFYDGETLLLCTDGLHGALDDKTIEEILGSNGPVREIAERLVATALERNGSDNITALVVRHAR
jgi:protein phosphatase